MVLAGQLAHTTVSTPSDTDLRFVRTFDAPATK
jgi:hypothetical protein